MDDTRSSAGNEALTTTLLPLALLWLAGVALRVTVLALPPVLAEVTSAFRLGSGDIGVLTAIPPLLFATIAIPGAALIGRVGPVRCLIAGLIVTAVGSALRVLSPGTLALELMTGVMCLGIALMQPALPALMREWVPRRIGLATGVYTFGLLTGEIVPAALPLKASTAITGAGWQTQLLGWSAPVVVAAIAVLSWRPPSPRDKDAQRSRARADWRARGLWEAGLLIGAVNTLYFGLNDFLPGWLDRASAAGETGRTLLALNLAQLPAAALMMAAAERLVFQRWLYALTAIVLLATAVGLAVAPTAAPVALAAVAGFCLALLLGLALTIPPLLAAEADVPRLSAGAFTIGYGLAVVASLVTGWLDRTGSTRASIVPMALAALLILAVGRAIGRLKARSADGPEQHVAR